MYFDKFPSFIARIGDQQKVVTDFFTRVSVGRDFGKFAAFLMPYVVKESERIEHVAYDFYKNADYYWVIILLNSIVDPREEWPKSLNDFIKYVTAKYGDDLYSVHHHELLNGVIIDSTDGYTFDEYTTVSNYEYEEKLNEAKRYIKLLDPQYLTQFVKNLENELR